MNERDFTLMSANRRIAVLVLSLLWFPIWGIQLSQAVPLTFQFQGHIAVDGVAFEGDGLFKFALLDGTGASLWSNDETSVAGSEPAASVTLNLVRGVYQVELGDPTLSNMAAISVDVFDAETLSLRVWFDDGVNGGQLLEPDTAIGSVAFAIRAASAEVADVAETVTSLPDGLIESTHLSAELQAQIDELATVMDKLVTLSFDEADADLLDAGYELFQSVDAAPWIRASSSGQATARIGHSGLWTGEDWLIWGGTTGAGRYLDTGAYYTPSLDAWRSISPINAPVARRDHSAVWTGESMLVWGGRSGNGRLDSGGRYNLLTGDWSPSATLDAPAARADHVAAWTGERLFVWGGRGDASILDEGGVYDPASDSWVGFDLPDLASVELGTTSVEVVAEIFDGSEGSTSNWTEGVDEDPPFLSQAYHVAAADGYVYVCSLADDSVSIFDMSDPANPDLVYSLLYNADHDDGPNLQAEGIGFIARLNSPWFSVIDGDRLYVSAHSSGTVSIFDVSDRTAPTRLGYITDTDDGSDLDDLDRIRALNVSGDLLAVGGDSFTNSSTGAVNGVSVLYLFNVADPESPEFLTKILDGTELPNQNDASSTTTIELGVGTVEGVIVGDMVYVLTQGMGRVYVVDISDPTAPTFVTMLEDGVGSFNRIGAPTGGALHPDGTLLTVSSGGGEDTVTLIDVSEPESPVWLSEIRDNSGGFTFLNHPIGVSMEGGTMAVAALLDDGFTLVDISDRTIPVLVDQRALAGGISSALDDQVAYVASNRADALTVVDFRHVPAARQNATDVWTGEQWIVWGGEGESGPLADGFFVSIPDGVAPTEWDRMDEGDEPVARSRHTAVWTGAEMIVWGGHDGSDYLGDGGRFDPVNNLWAAVSSEGAPAARADHASVWTGSEMLILGGVGMVEIADDVFDTQEFSEGYAYDPASDTWRTLSDEGSPLARRESIAAWTGDEALIFGGRASGSLQSSLQRLDPSPSLHLYRLTN